MNKLAQLGIIIKNNKAVVNSLDLSRYFDKEHYLVIRNIESLIENLGETHTLSEWAEKLNINSHTLYTRINRGWTIERSLFA